MASEPSFHLNHWWTYKYTLSRHFSFLHLAKGACFPPPNAVLQSCWSMWSTYLNIWHQLQYNVPWLIKNTLTISKQTIRKAPSHYCCFVHTLWIQNPATTAVSNTNPLLWAALLISAGGTWWRQRMESGTDLGKEEEIQRFMVLSVVFVTPVAEATNRVRLRIAPGRFQPRSELGVQTGWDGGHR